MDALSEIEALQAWRRGDREAGDRITRAYYGQVLGFFRLRVPAAAEDLTQRTFLACTEARPRVNSSGVRPFLFGIARNVLLKHVRDERRRVAHQDAPEVSRPQSVLSPSGVVAQRREHILLLRALERLSDETQMVIALHYIHGLSSREIAEILHTTTSTVTSRLHRARDTLRAEVAVMRAPLEVRDSLLDQLETWARSLGPLLSLPEAFPIFASVHR